MSLCELSGWGLEARGLGEQLERGKDIHVQDAGMLLTCPECPCWERPLPAGGKSGRASCRRPPGLGWRKVKRRQNFPFRKEHWPSSRWGYAGVRARGSKEAIQGFEMKALAWLGRPQVTDEEPSQVSV